jgi:hypothetical protein
MLQVIYFRRADNDAVILSMNTEHDNMGFSGLLKKREEAPCDIKDLYDPGIRDMDEGRPLFCSQELGDAILEYQDPEIVDKKQAFIFEREMIRSPDYYLPCYWVATFQMDNGNFEAAKKTLKDGIARCRMKSVLCRRLAEIYLRTHHLEESLRWFFTSIMADDKKTEFNSFLYLGYIFRAHGMKDASVWARRRARGMSYTLLYTAMDFTPSSIERIERITTSEKSPVTEDMLKRFYSYALKNMKDL